MRPVNLLPEADRGLRPASAPKNASYVVLGVLGALLLAVFVIVTTQNQINSRTTEIAEARQEAEQAKQRAAALGPFGQFATIKQTRVQSVTELAEGRFDWERLMRELALVLPEDSWVNTAAASADGAPEGATAAAAPADPETGTTLVAAGPSLNLVGCSPTQSDVAEVMVRLRNLHRADDVQLTESARPEEAEAVAGAVVAEPTTAGAAGECGDNYQWDVNVTFSPPTGPGPDGENGDAVPSSLGGGS